MVRGLRETVLKDRKDPATFAKRYHGDHTDQADGSALPNGGDESPRYKAPPALNDFTGHCKGIAMRKTPNYFALRTCNLAVLGEIVDLTNSKREPISLCLSSADTLQ